MLVENFHLCTNSVEEHMREIRLKVLLFESLFNILIITNIHKSVIVITHLLSMTSLALFEFLNTLKCEGENYHCLESGCLSV